MAKFLISIITPCYNEEDSIQHCYESVRRLFSTSLPEFDHEHIFSDNGSTDGTVAQLRKIAAQDCRVKVIVLSRNFGPFRSLFNALKTASGDAVLAMLPADLQDPPDLIPKFIEHWRQGHEIVYGIRRSRDEFICLRWGRWLFYRLVRMASDIPIPCDVGEFQLLDRKVVDVLKTFEDDYPYVRGMIAYCGFSTIGVPYDWKRRKHSRSKNRWFHLVDQALNGIIAYSSSWLRGSLLLGVMLMGAVPFVGILWAAAALVDPRVTFSWTLCLWVGLLFLLGLLFLFIGLLGEYTAAVHRQVRRRPMVVERERINC